MMFSNQTTSISSATCPNFFSNKRWQESTNKKNLEICGCFRIIPVCVTREHIQSVFIFQKFPYPGLIIIDAIHRTEDMSVRKSFLTNNNLFITVKREINLIFRGIYICDRKNFTEKEIYNFSFSLRENFLYVFVCVCVLLYLLQWNNDGRFLTNVKINYILLFPRWL